MKGRVAISVILAATAIGAGAMALGGEPASAQRYQDRGQHAQSGANHARRILDQHNAERRQLGLPLLKWNRNLEREASDWAQVLTRKGRLEHASRDIRNGTGENLWMGTAGVWDVGTMVDGFLDERRYYRHGAFPNVSTTGKWADVGHYTQIIWRDTKEVGCSVVTARGNDVLVCRYWPAGNVWGAKAY